ncbi:MAG: cupin domain-containing protein [Nannocystaceae bacterium]|nr:cupin domain-containing protein [Nannocystaceae bacterium]
MLRGNLYDDGEAPEIGESHVTLWRRGVAAGAQLRLEHIVSSAAPPVMTMDQDDDEWVALLVGTAVLEVAGERIELAPGDWLLLPARTPHRVIATTSGARWLAVHVADPGGSARVHGGDVSSAP